MVDRGRREALLRRDRKVLEHTVESGVDEPDFDELERRRAGAARRRRR
jgi:hypothetical protein